MKSVKNVLSSVVLLLVSSGCGIQFGSVPTAGSGNLSGPTTRNDAAMGNQRTPMTSPSSTFFPFVPVQSMDGKPLSLLPPLDAVDFVNPQTGWAGGNGIVLATSDGGKHWKQQYKGNQTVLQLDFLSSNLGYALTKSGLLFTQNGGQHWQNVTTPSAYTKSIDFTSSLTGWAVANGSLYETTDGGTTWRVHATSGGVDSVFFTTAETGFAVGSNQVLRTVDGGRSWHLVFSAPVNQQVVWQATVRAVGQSVWLLLVGDDAGMMKAAYVVFHSVDGGVNWTGVLANPAFASDYPTVKVQQDIDSYPGPFTALNERTAYFFGSCPACYAWGTTSVVSTLDSARTWSRALVSGEAYVQGSDSISFPDARHGWAAWTTASGQGEILSTPDGGREWMVQAPGDVGPIPTNVSPATVVMVPPGRSLHLPGVQAGTVVWQDGTIDSNGQSRPFYVWAGSGLVDAQSYSFLQVGVENSNKPQLFGMYVCPQNIGELKITSITDRGRIVHFASSSGTSGFFHLSNHDWVFAR